MMLASPAVMGERLYGATCLADIQGNCGTLFCLDAKTGALRWTTSTFKDSKGEERDFKGFFSSPAITADGRYLVIGQGLHYDDRCALVCVDARTGRLHWMAPTPLHIEGSPAIDGDLAVVGAGAIEGDDHKAKGHAGLVLAVKISTGEKLWEYEVADPESSPVIAGGVAYIGSGFNGNAVVALRTESDEELRTKGLQRLLWRAPTPHPATGAVTLADDLLLLGCGNGDFVVTDPRPEGAVLALDRKTGNVRWQLKMPDGVLGKIAVHGRWAIVPVRNGEVVALDLDAAGGAGVLWRQRVSGQKAILAGAAFTGTHVYAVSQDGYLAVLDAADGKLLEKHYLNAKGKPGESGLTLSSPLVSGGRVYAGSESGGLRCFIGKEVKP
jgi:outer membrane protein assembly factor BamB